MNLKKLILFAGALLVGIAAQACPDLPAAGQAPTPALTIVRCIDAATQRVWLAAEQITHPQIAEALGKAKGRGLEVQVLMRTPPPNYSGATYLKNHSVPVYLFDRPARQDKNFVVVDDKFVIDFDSEMKGFRQWNKQTLGEANDTSTVAIDPRLRISQDAKRADEFRKRFISFRTYATTF